MNFDHLRAPMPWLPAEGCTGCGAKDIATVDLYCGRRCAGCPPTFDRDVAIRLLMDGWPATARAYVRTFHTDGEVAA